MTVRAKKIDRLLTALDGPEPDHVTIDEALTILAAHLRRQKRHGQRVLCVLRRDDRALVLGRDGSFVHEADPMGDAIAVIARADDAGRVVVGVQHRDRSYDGAICIAPGSVRDENGKVDTDAGFRWPSVRARAGARDRDSRDPLAEAAPRPLRHLQKGVLSVTCRCRAHAARARFAAGEGVLAELSAMAAPGRSTTSPPPTPAGTISAGASPVTSRATSTGAVAESGSISFCSGWLRRARTAARAARLLAARFARTSGLASYSARYSFRWRVFRRFASRAR